jgi:hypothetical protein
LIDVNYFSSYDGVEESMGIEKAMKEFMMRKYKEHKA